VSSANQSPHAGTALLRLAGWQEEFAHAPQQGTDLGLDTRLGEKTDNNHQKHQQQLINAEQTKMFFVFQASTKLVGMICESG
jgi:hypothetical protein